MTPARKLKTENSSGQTCIIPMSDDYVLTDEMLLQFAQPAVGAGKRSRWVDTELLSYQSGTLRITAVLNKVSYSITFQVIPGELRVHCSCGESHTGLCVHAFYSLREMTRFRDDYFRGLLPGGPVDFAFQHRRWFTISWQLSRLYISSRKSSGSIYRFDQRAVLPEWKQAILLHPVNSGMTTTKALSYFITIPFKPLYKDSYRHTPLPAVIPCLGTLTKAGDAIKSFDRFLTGIGKEHDKLLTEEQRVLNLLALELLHKSEHLPAKIQEMEPAAWQRLGEAFHLWKQAFNFLRLQPYVYCTILYRLRDLKGKPGKKRSWKMKLNGEKPLISFKLLKQKDHYQLKMLITAGKIATTAIDSVTPFYIILKDQMFTWRSLHDAAVAEWFDKCGQAIVIAPEDLERFKTEVIQPLKLHYPVHITSKN